MPIYKRTNVRMNSIILILNNLLRKCNDKVKKYLKKCCVRETIEVY